MRHRVAAIFCFIQFTCTYAASTQELALARQLADQKNREAAIEGLVASGKANIPLMLRWMADPPKTIDGYELQVGIADSFGRLRAKETIPSLITCLGLTRYQFETPNMWIKTPDVVIERLPCVSALISIGPDASNAVMDAWSKLGPLDRLAATVVVSHVSGVPRAKEFLQTVRRNANLERIWAEEGLKLQQ
jgi:hypothetical protein